jgi:hypothetical protein
MEGAQRTTAGLIGIFNPNFIYSLSNTSAHHIFQQQQQQQQQQRASQNRSDIVIIASAFKIKTAMREIDGTEPAPRRKTLPLTKLLVLPAGSKEITTPLQSPRKPTDSVQERESATIVELLQRFKTLIDLAAKPVEEGATKEVAAAQAFEMEYESSALVSPIMSKFSFQRLACGIVLTLSGSGFRRSPPVDTRAEGIMAFRSVERHQRG